MKTQAETAKLGNIFDNIQTMRDGILDFKMFLDREWIFLPERIEVRSPIDNAVIATVPSASESEAEKAVESSYSNRNAIRTIPAVEKIEIFQVARDLLLENIDAFI
ncbi:MAG TPA: aldehyde dehydrogenase family protein, partial [Candidatus Bathyarchaeia archaeon]|nr:aldehyde dehydrogenase family protein [Candidatus Bathyarchaeia archaeon]